MGLLKYFNVRLQLFLLLSLLSLSIFSQAVLTKDGVELGDRSNFINSCIGGFDKDNIDLKHIPMVMFKKVDLKEVNTKEDDLVF
jgi:hypothetical protein